MVQRRTRSAAKLHDVLPPLPVNERLLQATLKALHLSPTQAKIVEWILRDASNRQIAAELGISESTLKTHQQRISARTGTRGRMQLAMRVMATSHQVASARASPERTTPRRTTSK